jgi:hypothetical protein
MYYKQLYDQLWLTITEKPDEYGYHYVITNHALPNTAFKTKQGFENYLKRTGLTMEKIRESVDIRFGKCEDYRLLGQYYDGNFTSIADVPIDSTHYMGLSNGSYVDYFYHKDNDGIFSIYRPNPNYPDIYKPVSMDEYRE